MFIRTFDRIRKENISEAGGKGANLGEMTNAGISVPRGAVLTASAYDRFIEANSIDISDQVNAASIREAIHNGILPGEIISEITEFYRSMGDNVRVAVRSSATAEDLEDASFAGQQETYLNVIGTDTLLTKIKDCYASLWGDRAVSYRRNSGYDKNKVSLAVVIQEMVESDYSGVMFTSDPAGDPDNILVNASYGLGEAVVSGIVSPDEYICDRNGHVIRENIGSKEIQIIYSGNGTRTVDVDNELRKTRVLNDSLVASLVKEGLKIEKHYGKPMDIEWAVKDGNVYILQARSITTLHSQERVFSDSDFEGLPVVKPAKGSLRESILFDLEKTPTPYYPLDHDFGGCVGEQKGILFEEIGITFKGGMYPINSNGIEYLPTYKMSLNKNIFKIGNTLKSVKDIENNMAKADRSLEECTALLRKEMALDPASAKEIGQSLKRMKDLIARTAYDRFLYALFPNAIESKSVNKVLIKIDPDLKSYDILEGLDYVTADINREMAVLTAYISNDPDMKDTVLNKRYSDIVTAYPDLGMKLNDFLDKFGSKSDFNCYCFISTSWSEDPDRFINTLRPMIRSGALSVPAKDEGMAKYHSIMDRVKKLLAPTKYTKFEHQVEGLRHYHYIREATQYLWESEFVHCRTLLRSLEAVTGIEYKDLMLLFAAELFDACEKGFNEDTIKLIESRRKIRPIAEEYWRRSMQTALSTEDGSVKGIGGSVGQATGKVCVVRSPAEFDKLMQGDILVCTYTDPEWTPLFTLAAGVVVDTGGTLSHAAIVAREYNIPAILATGDATKKLKDGEHVMIDGSTGVVTVLNAG